MTTPARKRRSERSDTTPADAPESETRCSTIIETTIPARLEYFDEQRFDVN